MYNKKWVFFKNWKKENRREIQYTSSRVTHISVIINLILQDCIHLGFMINLPTNSAYFAILYKLNHITWFMYFIIWDWFHKMHESRYLIFIYFTEMFIKNTVLNLMLIVRASLDIGTKVVRAYLTEVISPHSRGIQWRSSCVRTFIP